MPLKLALVFVGGGLGSCLRYLIGQWAVHHYAGARFPVGTFAVNVFGCLAIGVLAGLSSGRVFTADLPRTLLVIGFLGGFTTFSAFGFETFALLRNGHTWVAVAYAVASVGLAVVSAAAGYSFSR